MGRVSRSEALDAVRVLITYIGDDPSREGLQDTPERVISAWESAWGVGYHTNAPEVKCFTYGEYDQMIVQGGITFFSHCEHHLAPFFGKVTIGYIPDPKVGVIGLSKLARLVNYYSRRLQIQERLTRQVANAVQLTASTEHVGVIIKARHLCMASRGVHQHDTITTTATLVGEFKDDAATRSELYKIAAEQEKGI